MEKHDIIQEIGNNMSYAENPHKITTTGFALFFKIEKMGDGNNMSHLDKNLFLKNYFARLEFKRDTLEDEMK